MKKLVNREKIFKIILFIFPILFIFILEISLRFLNAFGSEPLFLEVTKNGKEYYQLNSFVAKRYFNTSDKIIPTLYPETFEKNKSTNTFRIFTLGGSTTAGFPFDYQVPFPQQLGFLLSEKYPEYNIEVINLGLSAVNSFTILDFIPEVLEKQPDLILIYMGHNEFYGVYGSASSYFIGENGDYIRFYLYLNKFQIVKMIKSIISLFSSEEKPSDKNTTLMEKMIKDKKVEYNSQKYKNTLNNYEENLELILELIQENNTPVIVSNLVSNIKDLVPFTHKEEISDNKELFALIAGVDSLLDNNNNIIDKNIIDNLLHYDSSSSYINYKVGQIYLKNEEFKKAKEYFLRAKDLDYVRFRATEDLNRIIEVKAKNKKVLFLDMEKLFSDNSIYNIIGDELICDHLHPNPNGYYLMAKGFFNIIFSLQLLPEQDTKFTMPKNPYYVTDLDWDIGLLKIYKLKHRLPFANKRINYLNYESYGNPKSGSIAYDYIFVHQNWIKAHENMARYYRDIKDSENELKEYETICNTFPEKYDFCLKVADMYKNNLEWKKVEDYYKRALQFGYKNTDVLFELGLSQWKQKKLTEAINSLQSVLIQKDLSDKMKQKTKYYLAGFFAESDSVSKAIQIVNEIISEDPTYNPAQILLNQLKAYQVKQ